MADPIADPWALASRWLDAMPADDLLVVDPDDGPAAVRLSQSTSKTLHFACTHWGVHQQLLQAGLESSFGTTLPATALAGALVFLSKGKERAALRIAQAAAWLKPGAPLWVVGPKRGGVNAVPRVLESLATAENTESGKHCKLISSHVLENLVAPNLEELAESWTLEHGQSRLEIVSFPGVFGHGRLDDGTAMLLDALAEGERLREPVLDLGAGAGVIGAWLASRGYTVSLSEVDAFALEAARRTLEKNGLQGVSVIPSDVLDELRTPVGTIVSNPPFHTGFATDHRISERLIRQAPTHLSRGGSLILVVNRFLPVSEPLEQTFGSFEVLREDKRYRVYRAVVRR